MHHELSPQIVAQHPMDTTLSSTLLSAYGHQCRVEVVLITPEIAAAFLQHQANNRPLRQSHIEFLRKQMAAGEWSFNGEPLIFDQDDQMIDGQHRCHACVKSGRPFVTLIVSRISRAHFDKIDIGTKRTAADMLFVERVPNAALAAAAIRLLLNWRECGTWWDKGAYTSPHDIKNAYCEFFDLNASLNYGQKLSPVVGMPSLWSAAHYVAAQKCRDTANDFLSRTITGLGMTEDMPEYHFRKRLLEFKNNPKFTPSPRALAGLFANAWNAKRRNRHLRNLKSVAHNEPVPELI